MEIGIREDIPTYSGGLGILAGDTLKAAADLGIPMVGVTLLYEKGYFTQELNPETGEQTEKEATWNPHTLLEGPLKERVTVEVEGRTVHIQAWRFTLTGIGGSTIPILFLDTNLEENGETDRKLTAHLYGGDERYRLSQEIVLGIGGVRMLKALAYTELKRYHMNEGHAALLALELFREDAIQAQCPLDDFEACIQGSMADIRKYCVFTTHTPVAAGHDKFSYDLVREVLGEFVPIEMIRHLGGEDKLNMTILALNLSHYVNSVARQHQHVSTHLFPGFQISNITNGIHGPSWTCPAFQDLFDKHIPNWRQDGFELRYALRIPENEVWDAHVKAKRALIAYLKNEGVDFDPDTFTIGFARRAAMYKRADLLFNNINRLREIARERPIQIIFAGKAHPADSGGKELIKKLFWHIGELKNDIKIVYLPDYDIDLAKVLIPGVDIWLNTPVRPKEASGTSGMKAAHNGVPHFSVLDGWWVEGHIDSITGWSIGPLPTEENENTNNDVEDANELYDKLQNVILPMYYDKRSKWLHVMRNVIAFNASFFNTHRMIQQYTLNAYLL